MKSEAECRPEGLGYLPVDGALPQGKYLLSRGRDGPDAMLMQWVFDSSGRRLVKLGSLISLVFSTTSARGLESKACAFRS
jgi:hypothetical protein